MLVVPIWIVSQRSNLGPHFSKVRSRRAIEMMRAHCWDSIWESRSRRNFKKDHFWVLRMIFDLIVEKRPFVKIKCLKYP